MGLQSSLISLADSTRATYFATAVAQANTSSSDAIVVESGVTGMITRIRRLIILHPGIQTTAGLRILQLIRTQTGSAGVITPATADTTSPAFGGVVRLKPTTQGLGGSVLLSIALWVPTALAAFTPIVFDFGSDNDEKLPTVNAGGQGIALRDPGAAGAANFYAHMIFTEE